MLIKDWVLTIDYVVFVNTVVFYAFTHNTMPGFDCKPDFRGLTYHDEQTLVETLRHYLLEIGGS